MTHDGFCPDCGFFQAHGAGCPTRLRTPKQRVERAAQLFHSNIAGAERDAGSRTSRTFRRLALFAN